MFDVQSGHRKEAMNAISSYLDGWVGGAGCGMG